MASADPMAGARKCAGHSIFGEFKMTILRNLLRDQSGASAAEYALILAIIGSALAIAAIGLGNTISNSMNYQASRITNCQDGTC
jgi:pilus assembly protein Flp/PilA